MRSRLPKILHRVVASKTSATVEGYWREWQRLHPDWLHLTWRDPQDLTLQWETAHLWDRCVAGAQLAGYIRLELMWRYGGVYVDSDLEPLRAIDPLCGHPFACREDEAVIPDFVLGFTPRHPAIRECLGLALKLDPESGPWQTGPAVTTAILSRYTSTVKIYPPTTFAAIHYADKARLKNGAVMKRLRADRRVFAVHHWAHSWASWDR